MINSTRLAYFRNKTAWLSISNQMCCSKKPKVEEEIKINVNLFLSFSVHLNIWTSDSTFFCLSLNKFSDRITPPILPLSLSSFPVRNRFQQVNLVSDDSDRVELVGELNAVKNVSERNRTIWLALYVEPRLRFFVSQAELRHDVSVYDLKNHKSSTLPFESRFNFTTLALSPNGILLVSLLFIFGPILWAF